MNKLYKILITGLFTICLLPSFSESFFAISSMDNSYLSANGSVNKSFTSFTCFYNYNTTIQVFDSSDTSLFNLFKYNIGCVSPGTYKFKNLGTIATNLFFTNKSQFESDLSSYFGGSCDYSGYVAEEDITQNYCTTKFNTLITQTNCDSQYNGYITQSNCDSQYSGYILESSVNQSYCENHGLCPISEGTGETQRSALYLNGNQIISNAIIDIYTEDYLNTDIEYLNDTVDIDISMNEDTEYIENVINKEKLTPTKEDFETLIIGLAEFIPYLFIALLILFFVKITKRIWK